ncbi:MAG TPA: hypothetical protein VIH30_05350 [Aquirhabdus sp.]
MPNDKITITQDSYVVLWSPHRKQFHVETVADRLQRNRRIFKLGKPEGDFIALAYANSHEEALAIQKRYESERQVCLSDQTG